MKCPKCGREMAMGAPHDERFAFQWECAECNAIVPPEKRKAATDITTLAGADWDELERDVVVRIRLLRAASQKLEANEVNDRIAQDLFLPAIRLLAEFCLRIEIE